EDTPTDECPMFPILIYDRAEKDKGNDGLYHPRAFVGVVLRGTDRFEDDDDDDEGGKTRFFDLEFVNLIWQGTIGSADFPVVHAVQICRTDQNPANCDV
ncbi:MAG: hypothetical protein ACRD1T_07210, partial [Acidimicrobiia bacterium]